MKLRLDHLKQNNLLLASKDPSVLILEQSVLQWLLTEPPAVIDPAGTLNTAASRRTALRTFDTVLSPLEHSSYCRHRQV